MQQKIEVEKLATLTGHRDCVYTLERGLEPGTFYSAAGDGQIALWNFSGEDKGELVANVDRSVYALKLLPGPNLLLIGHNFNGLQIIDLKEKKIWKTVPLPPVAIFDIAHYETGGIVFAALADGSIVALDDKLFAIKKVLNFSGKSVRSLAINHASTEMAAGYSDHIIRIFDLPSLALKHELKGHTNSVFAVKYSANGRHLLSGSRDAHLRVWDVDNQYVEREAIVAHMYTINDIEFSSDGRYFATCSKDKSIKIWDAESYKLLKVIDKARHAGHGTSVNKLFWTDGQNKLVSCSDDRTVSVWKLNFGLRYENHSVRDQAENI